MTQPNDELAKRIAATVKLVDNFPAPGVRFLDIGPVIVDSALFAELVHALSAPFLDMRVTHVLGIEARGLYFAGAVAARLGAGLVPVRKLGKLPPPTLFAKGTILDGFQVAGLSTLEAERPTTYQKAYEFEIAASALGPDAHVLIVDDLLAKGGSTHACRQLVARAGAQLSGAVFVIELSDLGGRQNLDGIMIHTLSTF